MTLSHLAKAVHLVDLLAKVQAQAQALAKKIKLTSSLFFLFFYNN
jgi:hypothetical protein